MDRDDFWEVTVLPSLLSRTTSSNDVLGPSVKIFNIEREAKRDSQSSSSERKRLDLNNSPRLVDSYQRSSSVLRENRRKLGDRMGEKRSSARSVIRKDVKNGSAGPFVELTAVHKVLDFVADSTFSATNNCCNEISRTLRHLIALRRDKNLDDLLSNDSSLYKCERCGVISHALRSNPAVEKIARKDGRDVDVAAAEGDCIEVYRNITKPQISTSHSNLKHSAQSGVSVDDLEVDRRAKGTSNETESSSVRKRSFATRRRRIASPTGSNNNSDTEIDANAKIKNTPDNSAIEKLFLNVEAVKQSIRYKSNNITRNDRCYRDGPSTKVGANIGTEKLVKKISYEDKWQINNFPAADWNCSGPARKSQDPRRFFRKDDDIISAVDTVKYFARGQFGSLSGEEGDLLSKLRCRLRDREENPRNRQSSVLYGSRDDYSRCDSGFWLFDESGRLPEAVSGEYRYLPTSRINNNCEGFGGCETGEEPRVTGSWTDCMDRDSLENCAVLERRRESDTVTFSSSSAENLMYECVEILNGKDDTNDADRGSPRGRRLVSSRPSLDIARHVRAEIDKIGRSDNARESISELAACDSNVLTRLSPRPRNKTSHSLGKMMLSDTVKHSVNHKITNRELDDCISTKLSSNKNCWIETPDDVIKTSGYCVESSKDFVKTPHERPTAPVCPEKHRKTGLEENCSGKITRRIVYKDASPRNAGNSDEYVAAEISPVYHEILQNSESMDWDGFRELIENLHPNEKELWRDICRTVNEEAEKMAGNANGIMEVCIEISPVIIEEGSKTDKPMDCAREIAFELDMTLKDIGSFLNKRPHLVKKLLDTHKDADEDVTNWDSRARKIQESKSAN